ncbi:MAG: AI-2E family transporter [Immundisolibacterales bacterium]|nr:AI-2E family transporter [Immundisolibacterales bacterium]
MHVPEHHPRLQSVLLAAAAFVVVVAGLKAAQALVNPFLLAVFIAVISTPALFWLESRGLPRGAALLVVILAVVGALLGLSVVVGASVNDFTNDLPRYTERLKGQFGTVITTLQGLGIELPQDRAGVLDQINPAWVLQLAGDLFNGFGVVLANAFLILLTVVFILLEASAFSGKLHAIARNAQLTEASVDAFTGTVRRYLGIKSLMSLGTGVAVWLWLSLLGVDYPILWGLLAFLLNFVPNIGSIIAAVPAVLLALVQLGPGTALWAAAGYLAANVVFGNVLEPRFMGRGVGLSALVVFLSLIFWGWVLGPVGMFLSVPLTITAKIALAASDETRWAAVLLGTGGEAAAADAIGGGATRGTSAHEKGGEAEDAKGDDASER